MYGIDDALLFGGLAASAAGTGLGIAGNEAARNAMNAARSRQVQTEEQFQRQGNQVFQQNLPTQGADAAKADQAQGAAQRESAFNALKQVAQPVAGSPLPTDNPNAVVSDNPVEQANKLASMRGNAWNNIVSNAGAGEGGYRDMQTTQGVNNAEANRRLGVINNMAQARAALFPTELQVASTKGDALSGWGQLFSALGSVAGTAGGVGAFGGGTGGMWGSNVEGQFGPLNSDTGQAPGGGWLWGQTQPGDL